MVVNSVRAILSIALLVLAFYGAGLTSEQAFRDAWATILMADRRWLMLSLLFIPIMNVVSAVKWHALVRVRELSITFLRLLGFYVIGRFYNLILPSSIGGDLIRVHLLGRHTGRMADAAAIVFVERFTGMITLLALTAVAILFVGSGESNTILWALVVLAAGGFAGLIWAFTASWPIAFLRRLLGGKKGLLNKLLTKFEKLRSALRVFGDQRKALVVSFGYSLLFYFMAALNLYVSLHVFESDLPVLTILAAVPIIMFIMNIPISIGNFGLMEFGHTVVLTQLGVSGEAAIATALLMRLKGLIDGGVGAVLYAFMGQKKIEVDDLLGPKSGA